MIEGQVIEDEPIVTLKLVDESGNSVNIDAIVDTGFSGHLMLPRTAIRDLFWPYVEKETVTLADGSTADVALYQATILWDGKIRQVPAYVIDGDRPLIGMKLMRGHLLTMECDRDGMITIEQA